MKAINILITEHRIIEQVLNCLERMVERCNAEGRLEKGPACDAIAFFRAFAECAHLAKEEAYLFPLMIGMKCPEGCSPADLTAREGEHAHFHLQAMEEAIEGAVAGDKDFVKKFVEHGQAYVGLLLKYIENEEDWLFRQANRGLDEEQQHRLVEQFQNDDAGKACHGSEEEYTAIANRLADHFGVPRAVLVDCIG